MPGAYFRELSKEFLQRRRIYTDCPRTLRSQMSVLSAAFGDLPIDSITVGTLERWFGDRRDAGVNNATLNRNRSALSQLFEWAILEGYRSGLNPAKGIRRFRESVGRTRWLTPDEASRFLLASPPHLRRILMIALHTGGRLQEVLTLTWGDVDQRGGWVTFRRETTKGKRERNVPISDALAVYLRGIGPGAPGDLVCTWDGHRIKTVKRAFATARKKAGLGRDVGMSQLRHTMASWATMNGLDLRRLQRYLGHSDPKLTERYSHMTQEYQQEGARFLGPPRARQKDEDDGRR